MGRCAEWEAERALTVSQNMWLVQDTKLKGLPKRQAI